MADDDGAQESKGWRGPDVPVWQGLLLIAVVIALALAIEFSGLPRLIAICAAVLVIVLTARWWRPLFRRSS